MYYGIVIRKDWPNSVSRFFREGGDVRFDEYEDWTVRTSEGQNLYMVALHEIGHAFGLDHSNTAGAIMNPYYTGYVKGKGLQPDDIAGIQAIYGIYFMGPATTLNTSQPSNKLSTIFHGQLFVVFTYQSHDCII